MDLPPTTRSRAGVHPTTGEAQTQKRRCPESRAAAFGTAKTSDVEAQRPHPEGHPLARYAVTGAGLKLRIHPLAAAIAHDQLARLDGYLAGRAEIARYLTGQIARIPGLEVTEMPDGVIPSWYGLTLTYKPDELDGLPIERFHQALIAEGATEFDRPGSTCPMNQLPLYQQPGLWTVT
ncbi:DegT/DnrJ/EryC1/StrS family aminotransferase [Kitasatospora sp. NPDC028055]|uniref:DegT/DnrJ/EryC1/StrS family aminotransferase n=1 Tax=Kitasatospora sp. NPDC028055 TaxID=3155653 RepID=UPI0033F8BA38